MINNTWNFLGNQSPKPELAFITFEEEDGKIVADSYENKDDSYIPKFLGTSLKFIEATEPTNIIWENRHYDDAHYYKQGIKVFILVACLLAVSFITIYFFKSDAIAQASKYPTIRGKDVIRQYQDPPNNFADNSRMSLLYEHAKSEYEYLLEAEKNQKKPSLNGFYQTYCFALDTTPERFETLKNDKTYDPSICDKFILD